MSRSTAGVLFASSCEWLGHVHRSSGYRGRALVVPQALAFTSDPDFKVAAGVRELAHISQQKRDTVIAQLRQLEDDGWVDRAGRRRGRGAGRGGATTVLELTLPSLLRRSQVPPGGFGSASEVALGRLGRLGSATGVAAEGLGSATGVAAEGLGSATGVAAGGLGSPHTPGVGVGVEVPHPTPNPRPSPASDAAADLLVVEALELIRRFPIRMQPVQPRYADEFARQVAAWLAQGWHADELVEYATAKLPAGNIPSPLGLLKHRVPDRPPVRVGAGGGTPTPSRWQRVSAERLDDERRAELAADARGRIRAARSSAS